MCYKSSHLLYGFTVYTRGSMPPNAFPSPNAPRTLNLFPRRLQAGADFETRDIPRAGWIVQGIVGCLNCSCNGILHSLFNNLLHPTENPTQQQQQQQPQILHMPSVCPPPSECPRGTPHAACITLKVRCRLRNEATIGLALNGMEATQPKKKPKKQSLKSVGTSVHMHVAGHFLVGLNKSALLAAYPSNATPRFSHWGPQSALSDSLRPPWVHFGHRLGTDSRESDLSALDLSCSWDLGHLNKVKETDRSHIISWNDRGEGHILAT